jgi:hypothetical protein
MEEIRGASVAPVNQKKGSQMRSRNRIITSVALACAGALGGAAAAHAAHSRGQPPPWTPGTAGAASAELATESGFYLRVEPARIARDGAGEALTLSTRLGTTRAVGARSIMSVQVEDDRGAVVRPATVSPRMSLPPASEIAGAEVTVAPLPDGWYRLRAQAVFVDPAHPTEAMGSESASVYLEVRGGEISVVDMNEWFAASNVNLGRLQP